MKVTPSKKRYLGFLTVLFATALLVWCFHGVEWKTFFLHIGRIRISYLLLGFLVSFSIIWVKAFQIRFLLPDEKQIPLTRLFQLVSVLLMMVSTVPLGGGHAMFVYLMGKKENLGKTVALSVLTQDQLLDGFGKVFIIVWGAILIPFPPMMARGLHLFVAFVVVSCLIGFLIAYRYRNAESTGDAPQGWGWDRFHHGFIRWAYHLRAIRDPRKFGTVVLFTSFMRVQEALAVYFVQEAFGLNLPFSTAVVVVAALSLANTLPLSPGRVGLFEAAAYATYMFLGVSPSLSIALALFVHLVHSMPFILTGYLVSLTKGLSRRMPAEYGKAGQPLAVAES